MTRLGDGVSASARQTQASRRAAAAIGPGGELAYVAPGMPPLRSSGRAASLFEFWPLWLLYLPVVLQWLLLAVRYRSLTLPLIANPAVPLSGMVGVEKSAVLQLAGDHARQWILPWISYRVTTEEGPIQLQRVLALLQKAGLALPVVGKPDIGCRGAGVKLLREQRDLLAYLQAFPAGSLMQLQKLSQWQAEAGVFYIRHPHNDRGEIFSLALKYTPYVVGDGNSTLAQLVAADPRAGRLPHVRELYRKQHREQWARIIPAGEPYRLVFSASHCRGAVFRDGSHLVDPRLVKTLDRIFDDIPGYHYGRLDIKFADVASLRAGKSFEIIEINGASSEAIHIWDCRTSLRQAVATLLRQYSTLFTLGAANRRLGFRPAGVLALFKAWRREWRLVRQYPEND